MRFGQNRQGQLVVSYFLSDDFTRPIQEMDPFVIHGLPFAQKALCCVRGRDRQLEEVNWWLYGIWFAGDRKQYG